MPGMLLARSINSGSVVTPSDGVAAMTMGRLVSLDTGANAG
jgi:hypothetical protein